MNNREKIIDDIAKEIANSCYGDNLDNTPYIKERILAAHEKIASMREGHEELFEQIDKWAEAYPTDIFPEVPTEDWLRVRKALEDAGLSLDRVSASNMRHVVTRIKELADKVRALKC